MSSVLQQHLVCSFVPPGYQRAGGCSAQGSLCCGQHLPGQTGEKGKIVIFLSGLRTGWKSSARLKPDSPRQSPNQAALYETLTRQGKLVQV